MIGGAAVKTPKMILFDYGRTLHIRDRRELIDISEKTGSQNAPDRKFSMRRKKNVHHIY